MCCKVSSLIPKTFIYHTFIWDYSKDFGLYLLINFLENGRWIKPSNSYFQVDAIVKKIQFLWDTHRPWICKSLLFVICEWKKLSFFLFIFLTDLRDEKLSLMYCDWLALSSISCCSWDYFIWGLSLPFSSLLFKLDCKKKPFSK